MIRGVRPCRRIYATSPQKDMVDSEFFPGSTVQGDAELAQLIRRHPAHPSHPVGTCRMGLDALALVDAALRVHGIEGLRVADASVMPEAPSGNTKVPPIMIGEKAADLLRGRGAPAPPGNREVRLRRAQPARPHRLKPQRLWAWQRCPAPSALGRG